MQMSFSGPLIHYQQNLGCEPATYLSVLNHEDPGVSTVSTQFFSFPDEAVKSSLGEDERTVQMLEQGLPAGPAEGHRECQERCGLIAPPEGATGRCHYNGQSQGPGKWLQGPALTCMCSPYGSGKWIQCREN